MLKDLRFIGENAKKRAMSYLMEMISKSAISGVNANDNIDIVKSYLLEHGVQCRETLSRGHRSIMAGTGRVLFNSHVDVVPGKESQFRPHIHDGFLYARGASDALGCCAAMVVAIQELHKRGKDFSLMLVSDEELGGIDGTRHILEKIYDEQMKKDLAYVIVGEPTECGGFSIREKGILRLELEVYGSKTHPEKETINNAIINAANIMQRIAAHPLLSEGDNHYGRRLHINPTLISGGVAANIIPDEVLLEYDIRFAPGLEIPKILKIFDELSKELPFSYRVLKSRAASYVDTSDSRFRRLAEIAGNPGTTINNGASDYSYFFEHSIPGVVYGVRGANWHDDDEYLELDSFYTYMDNLIAFVEAENGR